MLVHLAITTGCGGGQGGSRIERKLESKENLTVLKVHLLLSQLRKAGISVLHDILWSWL